MELCFSIEYYRKRAILLILTALGGKRKQQQEAEQYELQHVLNGRDPAKMRTREYTMHATAALKKLDPSYLSLGDSKDIAFAAVDRPITAVIFGGTPQQRYQAAVRPAHVTVSCMMDNRHRLETWCVQRLSEFNESLMPEYAAYFCVLLANFVPFAGIEYYDFQNTLFKKTPTLGYMLGLWHLPKKNYKLTTGLFGNAWKQHKHEPSGKLYADALYANGLFKAAFDIYAQIPSGAAGMAQCYYFGHGVPKQDIILARLYNAGETPWLSALCVSFEPTVEDHPTVMFATRVAITKTLSSLFTAVDVASMRLVCRAWNATIMANGAYWKDKRGLRVSKITKLENFTRVFFAQKHACAVKSIAGRIATAHRIIARNTALLGELEETQSKLKRHKR